MRFYGDQVLPRFIDFALSGGVFARLRARVTAGLARPWVFLTEIEPGVHL